MVFNLLDFASGESGLHLNFDWSQNVREGDTNRYSVITGPNGVGKSRLLKAIADYFAGESDNRQQEDLLPLSQLFRDDVPPRKVLAISNMVFDRFPMTEWHAESYVYLGARQGSNMLTTSTWSSFIHESCYFLSIADDLEGLRNTLDLLDLKASSPPIIFRSPENRKRYDFLRHELEKSGSEHKSRLNWTRNEKVIRGQLASMSDQQISSLRRVLEKIDSLPFLTKSKLSHHRSSFHQDFLIFPSEMFSSDDMWALRFCAHHGLVGFRADFRREEYDLAVEDFSAGEQLLLSLMSRVLSNIASHSLVLIDEPDVGLHPGWQSQFIPLLRSSLPGDLGCHFVMASHSPLVVAEGSDVLVPGDHRGLFVPFLGSTEGRSIENILYETFRARSPRSQMVEEDLNYLIKALSLSPKVVDPDRISRTVSRVSAIAGDDTPAVNLLLNQVREHFVWLGAGYV